MAPIVVTDRFDAGHPWAHYGLHVAAQWDGEPTRDETRAVLREASSEGVIVSGSAASLNAVVDGLHRSGRIRDVPIGFLAGHVQSSDLYATIGDATATFVSALGLPRTLDELIEVEPMQLPLTRNDIGGVMLIEARCERAKLRPFGMQAYHDDTLIADGRILGLTVAPDYARDGDLQAKVTPARRGSIVATYGRAVQVACDEVPMQVDGRDGGAITKRTWYVDDRTHWLLRAARRPDVADRRDRAQGRVPGTEPSFLKWAR